MEKAYDLKELGKRLQEAGVIHEDAALDILEKLAGDAYLVVKQWGKESAPLSDTKIDDFASPYYDLADNFVLPQIDKINGKEG